MLVSGRVSHRIHGTGIFTNIWLIFMGSMWEKKTYMDPIGIILVG